VDLADDEGELIDSTFDDLDDPDGLLRTGAGEGYRAELFDDEALDLLGDIDEGLPEGMIDAFGRGDHAAGWVGDPVSLGDRFADRPGDHGSSASHGHRFADRPGDHGNSASRGHRFTDGSSDGRRGGGPLDHGFADRLVDGGRSGGPLDHRFADRAVEGDRGLVEGWSAEPDGDWSAERGRPAGSRGGSRSAEDRGREGGRGQARARRSGETVGDRFGGRAGRADRTGDRSGGTVGERFGNRDGTVGERFGGRAAADRHGEQSADGDGEPTTRDAAAHRGERVEDLRPGDRASTVGRTRR